jgi:hypothetical protein
MKVLFIGGQMDGYRRDWPASRDQIANFAIRCPGPFNAAFATAHCDQAVSFKTDTYTLRQFAEGDNRYFVAAHPSVKNTMEKLIKGYHGHRHGRSRRV